MRVKGGGGGFIALDLDDRLGKGGIMSEKGVFGQWLCYKL